MNSLSLSDNFSVVIPIVAGVGNALMAVPMARQIKRHRPGARVGVAALIDAMAEPFRRLPEIDQVYVSGKGKGGLKRAVQWTRAQRADVYLVPFPSNRWQYNVLAAASGARHVVMHAYPIGKWSTLTPLSGAARLPAQRGIHDVRQNLRLLTLLGIEPDMNDRPVFVLREEDRARGAQLLADSGLSEAEPFIAVHAGSARTILAQAKRWPAASYARLIHAMHREFGHRIALLEGPDEAGVAGEILSHLPGGAGDAGVATIKLAGPLADAAALLARAKLYVGSDSGLAHLADAVGTRAVTLFAPADPDRVCPSRSRDLVVQPARDCSPCFLYPWEATSPKMRCREPMCIQFITAEQVLSVVRKGLA